MSAERFRATVAVHLFFVRDGSILLLRRANTGYEDGNYSVPAGHLDGGETVTQAAIRESLEEVGTAIRAEALEHAVVMHRRAEAERIDFFMTATEWDGEPRNREPEKCDELRWAPTDGLPANVVPYVRRAIEAWMDGERYLEFGWD
ncbi:MAG: NUDIX domain-containing protein [Dehalococcoidia bacterium]